MKRKKHSPTIVLGIVHIKGEVLLIKRNKPDKQIAGLVWAFPGGWASSNNTDPASNLIQEILSETGLKVRNRYEKPIFVRTYPGTDISIWYYDCLPINHLRLNTSEPDEVEELRWIKSEQVKEIFTSDIHPFILGYLKGIQTKNEK